LKSIEFAKEIADIILTKKGFDIKILKLDELTGVADYFLICSADSDIQVKAISDEVERNLSKRGIKCFHKEGERALNWVLLDYFDVVVHVFRKDIREYYNLEKLWGDAEVIEVNDETDDETKE